MLPRYHALAAVATTVVTFPRMGKRSLVVGVASFLIDVDHYVWYALRYHRFGLREAERFFLDEGRRGRRFPATATALHTVEALTCLCLLSLRLKVLRPIVAGFILHLALDVADDWRHNGRLRRPYLLLAEFPPASAKRSPTSSGRLSGLG